MQWSSSSVVLFLWHSSGTVCPPSTLSTSASFLVSVKLLSALSRFFQSFCSIFSPLQGYCMITGSLSCLPFSTFLQLILHICRHYATFFSEVLSGFLLNSQYLQDYSVLWDSPNLSTSSLTSPKLVWLPFSFFLPLTEGTLEHFQSFCLFHIPLTLQPLFLKFDWIF